MKLKTPLALGLLQAAAFAAEKESGSMGSQILEGFMAIPAGGTGLIISVIVIFVVAFIIGFFIGSR